MPKSILAKSILFAKSFPIASLALSALVSFNSAITAQTPAHPPAFSPVEPIAFDNNGPVIRAHTETLKPFTVAGERGVLLGQQDGTFEAWVLPVKVLSHMTIEANVEGYSVPIDVNQQSAEIEVRPDRTTITYSHVAFTVRQIMFSSAITTAGTGPIVLFEFDCLHPTDFTFRFTPNLEFMWPMRNEGVPGVEWVTPHAPMQAGDSREENDTSGLATSGYYVLHSDYPDLAAAVTIPGARAGILAPYQERPQVHPVELKIHFDPTRDHGRLYPLLMAIGTNPATASAEALGSVLNWLNQNVAMLYKDNSDSYKKLLANSVSIDTPDKSLNEAFQWAVVSIEQLKAKPWSPDSEGGGGFNPRKSVAESKPALAAEEHPSSTTNVASGHDAAGKDASGHDLIAETSRPEGHDASGHDLVAETSRPEVHDASGHDLIAETSQPEGHDASGHDLIAETSRPEGHDASGHDFSRAEKDAKEKGALAPAGRPVPATETALVAGYFASGDSARPGFGWFFGRDSLYTLYAVNGYGDFALAKSELEFLIHRQREDGKIMHEYSQTAAAIDWRAFPYMYAAADSTPLFLLATLDYVRSSGDTAFLTNNREAIEKAWEFETSHAPDAAHGGNGIYTNEQGTGWVESWPGGMPHQEVYLALLDQQASAAMAQIFSLLNDQKRSLDAKSRADSVAKTINDQFYDADKHCYAFSRNKDGSLDRTTTVYPALAWWSDLAGTTQAGATQSDGAHSILQHPEGCLQQLAAHTLNTDWGLRDVSNEEKIYDGMSYHQGSVWPLFTGWAALAEYRANQPLAGYQMLMENANLTKAQDLGSVTELLSGDFNVPFGRSTSHQLWSSAMVITPILRGLFGINIDATTKTITVNPHLPAGWNQAELAGLQLPSGRVSLSFSRNGEALEVCPYLDWPDDWHLRSDIEGSAFGSLRNDKSSKDSGLNPCKGLRIPLPTIGVEFPTLDPLGTGARTSTTRILNEDWSKNRLTVIFEGEADSETAFGIHWRRPLPGLKIDSPENKGINAHGDPFLAAHFSKIKSENQNPRFLWLHFPPGEGWKTITVTLTW